MRLDRRHPFLQRRGFHGVNEIMSRRHQRLTVASRAWQAGMPAVQSVDLAGKMCTF